MLPYFINLNNRIISNEETLEIKDFSVSNLNKFTPGLTGYDGNFTLFGPILNNLPIIDTLIKQCNCVTKAMILCQLPKTEVIKHTDVSFSRTTILMTPISPLVNYPPTYFWKTLDDTNPVINCSFENNSSILFNTHKIHSLKNDTDEHRFSLQFAFYEDIETVYKLYSSGQLFKKEPRVTL